MQETTFLHNCASLVPLGMEWACICAGDGCRVVLLVASVLASMRWLLCGDDGSTKKKRNLQCKKKPRENLSPFRFSENLNRIKLQSLQICFIRKKNCTTHFCNHFRANGIMQASELFDVSCLYVQTSSGFVSPCSVRASSHQGWFAAVRRGMCLGEMSWHHQVVQASLNMFQCSHSACATCWVVRFSSHLFVVFS